MSSTNTIKFHYALHYVKMNLNKRKRQHRNMTATTVTATMTTTTTNTKLSPTIRSTGTA